MLSLVTSHLFLNQKKKEKQARLTSCNLLRWRRPAIRPVSTAHRNRVRGLYGGQKGLRNATDLRYGVYFPVNLSFPNERC